MLFEPEAEEMIGELLVSSLEVTVYRALLESTASEHGARMTAMRNASENANDLINAVHAGDEPRPPGRDHAGDPRGRGRRGRPAVTPRPGERGMRAVRPRTQCELAGYARYASPPMGCQRARVERPA